MSIDFYFPKMVELAKRMSWEGKEVLRDIDDKPQLFERITLSGPRFEHRALVPFVRIGDVESRLVEIDEDGLQLRAYFDQTLPDNQPIEFGYYDEGVIYRFPRNYRSRSILRLDRKRLPKNVQLLKAPSDRTSNDDVALP